MDHFDQALQLLATGQLDEARIHLEELLRQIPIIPISSTTRDLCYVDLGQLDQGLVLLHRCLQLAPQHSHPAWPSRTWSLSWQGRRQLRALYYLHRSHEIDPQDPQTVYGLAFTA
jgi:predicted Zn-dependent protease